MASNAAKNPPRPHKTIRQFHVVWTKPPSDEVVIDAGARALRLYADRTAQEPDSKENQESVN